jgi:hypothetical protein
MTKKQVLAVLAIFGLATVAQATTYSYTGTVLSVVTNFTAPCAIAPCANYTGTSNVTGSLTTAAPLAANLPAGTNISALAASFSFTDGVNTISSSDPNTRRFFVLAGTDGTGNIVGADILLEIWETGTSPHSAGNRFSFFEFGGGTLDRAYNNVPCATVGTSALSDLDTCIAAAGVDLSTSQATSAGGSGVWSFAAGPPVAAVGVPTLSEWALALLAALVALGAVMALRGKRLA